jgi:hypothetical protein
MLLLGAATPLLIGAAPARTRRLVPLRTRDDGRPVVRWILRDEDLLSCQTPAYALRHLRNRYGSALDLEVIGIGVDEASARAFLRAQRLDVTFYALSATEYRREFASQPVPGVFVLLRNRVLRSYPAVPARPYPSPDQIIATVQASLRPIRPLTSNDPTSRRPS